MSTLSRFARFWQDRVGQASRLSETRPAQAETLVLRQRRTRSVRATMRLAPVESLEDRMLLSAPDQWLQRGLSGGGVLENPALSPHNPNEIYLATDMTQVFHSKDLGASWDFYGFNELITSNKENGVQFTSDPMVLFALDADNLAFPTPARSIDAGATWHRAGSAGFPSNWPATEQAWRLFADPDSAGRMIVGTTDEIFLSTDGGATFTSVYTYTGTINASQKKGLHVAGAHFDGSNIYVGTNAGLLVSTNGGAFQPVAVGGIPATEAIFSFAGATELDANGNAVTRLWAITITASSVLTPIDPNFNYTTYQNLYSLDVGQANWAVNTTGMSATTDLLFVATAPHDISTAYVAGQESLFNVYVGKYDAAAGTWTSQFNTKIQNNNVETGYGGPGGHLNFSPAPEGLAVASNDPNRVVVSDGYFAYISTDGGQAWQQLYVPESQDHAPGQQIPKTDFYNNTGLNNTTVWWIHWQDDQQMFVAYDDVKYQRSVDGGATWTFDVTGLDVKKENFHIEQHPTSGRLFLSQGRNWPAHDFLGLSDSAINQGGGDIAFSDDGGATWKILYDFGNPVAWTAIDPKDPNTMYASVLDPDPTVGGLYVSHNIDLADTDPAAVSFTRLAAQPSGSTGRPHTIEVLDDGTLVLVLTARKYDHDNNPATGELQTAGSGVYRLDPGASQWTDVTGTVMHYWCKDLVVDPYDPTQSTWYVGVNNAIQPVQFVTGQPSNQPGLYMTTDRGESWTRIFTQDADHIAVHPDNPAEAYVTSNRDGLYYTQDLRLADGTMNPAPTFTQVASFPHVRPNRVFFNPYNHDEVWVATNGGGMILGNATLPDREFNFSAASYTVSENTGTATMTVTRSGDTANAMSVDYTILAGTASQGVDFASSNLPTGITGTLSFAPGQSSVSLAVTILDDSLIEGSEQLTVTLSGPIGGNVLGANAASVLTILDDDLVPDLSIDDVTVTEGDGSSPTTAVFTVRLSAATGRTVTVDLATTDGSANQPNDYSAIATTTLTFAPGTTTQTVSVSVVGDTTPELDETFFIQLSNAVGANIATAQGTGTILNDDAWPPTHRAMVTLASPTFRRSALRHFCPAATTC